MVCGGELHFLFNLLHGVRPLFHGVTGADDMSKTADDARRRRPTILACSLLRISKIPIHVPPLLPTIFRHRVSKTHQTPRVLLALTLSPHHGMLQAEGKIALEDFGWTKAKSRTVDEGCAGVGRVTVLCLIGVGWAAMVRSAVTITSACWCFFSGIDPCSVSWCSEKGW